MDTTVHEALAGWESFYVIVGSSAAALIGLQFVVMALIADTTMRRDEGAIKAFGTPQVVNFGAVLVIAAINSAPWSSFGWLAGALAACGLVGVAYIGSIMLHARRQKGYAPVLQDWLWFMILPLAAYAILAVGSFTLGSNAHRGLFLVGMAALGLLLIAIHNAWDTIAYIVLNRDQPPSV